MLTNTRSDLKGNSITWRLSTRCVRQIAVKGPNTWKWNICIFSHEKDYWWWMRHVPARNFGLHLLTTLVPTFFCPCFAHIGPQPTITPPPTLCSIPLTCIHWIQNPSRACVGLDTKFCNEICFITNATQASALNKFLITTHFWRIVKSDY
jgi:hypothetical protein